MLRVTFRWAWHWGAQRILARANGDHRACLLYQIGPVYYLRDVTGRP